MSQDVLVTQSTKLKTIFHDKSYNHCKNDFLKRRNCLWLVASIRSETFQKHQQILASNSSKSFQLFLYTVVVHEKIDNVGEYLRRRTDDDSYFTCNRTKRNRIAFTSQWIKRVDATSILSPISSGFLLYITFILWMFIPSMPKAFCMILLQIVKSHKWLLTVLKWKTSFAIRTCQHWYDISSECPKTHVCKSCRPDKLGTSSMLSTLLSSKRFVL